jgi:dipeptidyl aminopeptidase/acylaminoacyl peptidase
MKYWVAGFLSLILSILELQLWADDIPVESFFKSTGFGKFRVSPNGKYLSALAEWKGATNLYVIDLKSRTPIRVTAIKDQTIKDYFWGNDDRLLFTMDYHGNESWGLFAVDRDGENPRVLVPPLTSTGSFVFRYTWPLDLLKKSHDEILVVNNERNVDYPDVYRLNINDGGKVLSVANPGTFTKWFTDQNSNVRLAEAKDIDGSTSYHYREREGTKWESIAKFSFKEKKWSPAGPQNREYFQNLRPPQQPFGYDHNILYISSDIGRAVAALYEFNLKTRKVGRMIYECQSNDVSHLILSDYIQKPVGVYFETDKLQSYWFHEEKKMIQEFLDRKFPGLISIITNVSDDHSRLVIASYSDRHPVIYSLLSITDGRLDFEILADNSIIEPTRLSEVKPIVFEARDGVTLHGYLTLPNDKNPKNLPMILHPHGGPWVRDSWGYNPEVQFLANRGFVVLQINFRSSQGYGREFLHAGDKLWGTTMQTDLVDGIKWVVDQGIVDRNRIGIYGSSYGGYATMAQLVFYPELYQFGITAFGPIDLISLINWRKKSRQKIVYAYYTKTIGDPKADKEMLNAYSPANYLHRIQAPVFIVHGTRDSRVPIDQAKRLRSGLIKENKDYAWLVKKDEGHGFRKTKNKIELYTRMDEFLQPFRNH